MKRLPEYIGVDGRTMKADEAIELWLKDGVPPEEIKKRLMVLRMLPPVRLRRLYKELSRD